MRISDWSSDVCSSELRGARSIGNAVPKWLPRPSCPRPSPAPPCPDQRDQRHHDSAQNRAGLDRALAALMLPRIAVDLFVGGIARRHVEHAIFLCKGSVRSEEHTSELQSLMRISYAVFCLKKKKQHKKM